MTALPDSHADLLDNPGVVSLSTIGPDGYPQVTAIWFLREGDVIVTSLTDTRQKTKNLVARPTGTLFFIDPANAYRTLEIRADVTIEPDPGLETMARVIGKYGADLETFPAPKEGRVKVTFTPHRVVANG
jgi:PPOX class probable F420-dependent enzyme